MGTTGKVMVIGLDGATFRITTPLIEKGRMPCLGRIIESGASGILESTIPPMSATAWISFMTGKNPGKHGIYNFRTLDLTKYTCFDEDLVSSSSIKEPTIFDIASSYGRRVCSLYVPVTYPPWEINGVMISGYPTPDTRKAFSFPPQFGNEVGLINTLTQDQLITSNVELYSKSLDFQMQKKCNILLDLMKKDEFSLMVYVNDVPDGVQHKFWRYTENEHPLYNEKDNKQYGYLIDKYYNKVDQIIERIIAAVEEDTIIYIMSDHGGGARPWKLFNTNYWLMKEGYLRLKTDNIALNTTKKKLIDWAKENLSISEWVKRNLPKSWKERIVASRNLTNIIQWKNTSAYRVPLHSPYEGINLNVKGRQPEGIVNQGLEYEELRSTLIKKVLQVKHPQTGKNFVRSTYKKEEIYHGPHAENAPDIIILLEEGYEGGAGLSSITENVSPALLKHISGEHTMDGIFMACGKAIRKGIQIEGTKMVDLAPTILYSIGTPIPDDMDGRILTEIFTDQFIQSNKVETRQAQKLGPSKDHVLSDHEREEMKKALRGLGYIE